MSQGVNVKSLRLTVEKDGRYFRGASVGWSNQDASIFLKPLGLDHVGAIGHGPGPAHGASTTISTGTSTVGIDPYLSLHQSGQVHAKLGKYHHGPPQQATSLAIGEVGHVASVLVMRLDRLRSIATPNQGVNPDIVVPLGDQDGVRFVIHLEESAGDSSKPGLYVTLARQGLSDPVRFRIVPKPLGFSPDPQGPGVLAIAGWGPGVEPDDAFRVVYAYLS